MSQKVLTNDQQKAFDTILSFLCDPNQTFFVLEGFAGTGKTFLMNEVVNEWQRIQETVRLLNPNHRIYDVVFTATTNKAAEELAKSTGSRTSTIFSALGLALVKEGTKNVIKERTAYNKIANSVIVIDESSYLDKETIDKLQKRTQNCKFIFLGDPAQLVPVGYSKAPVFDLGYPTAQMREVKRNGGKILELSALFRDSVFSDKFPHFVPDGNEILWVPRDKFGDMIDVEFERPDWKYSDSKILAWQNYTAIEYGKYVKGLRSGTPAIQVGDYMSVNSYIYHPLKRVSLKTDEVVLIQDISNEHMVLGVIGKTVRIKDCDWFCPTDPKDKKKAQLAAAKRMSINYVSGSRDIKIVEYWIDLRELTSQTVNKSQGSTYKKVFIDLDDLAKCHSSNQLARMLYVATSRASEQVIFTGDIA